MMTYLVGLAAVSIGIGIHDGAGAGFMVFGLALMFTAAVVGLVRSL